MSRPGDDPAFPETHLVDDPSVGMGIAQYPGLTKRELTAIENHAQLIRFVHRGQMTSEAAAALAVKHADALFAYLAKEGA